MLFTQQFLEELSEKTGAHTMLDHYINDLGMSFRDAVLRLANFHGMQPVYFNKGDPKIPLSEEAQKLLNQLLEENRKQEIKD